MGKVNTWSARILAWGGHMGHGARASLPGKVLGPVCSGLGQGPLQRSMQSCQLTGACGGSLTSRRVSWGLNS